MATPIINQQLEDIKDAMDDVKDAIENLPFAGVPEAVDDWLDEHPEATTTVQDGAITEAKLASALSDKIFKPKKVARKVMAEDNMSAGQIYIDQYIENYEELTIVIYQSDATNNGTRWSTNDTSNYFTIRKYKQGESDTYISGALVPPKGDKPVIAKLRRIQEAIIGEVKNGDEATVLRVVPRQSSDKDYVTWFSINANTGCVIKAGTVIEAYISNLA